MQVFPAIDLLAGKGVRLHQGRYDAVTVFVDDPPSHAAAWAKIARQLHVVDLEGAREGRPVQRELVRAVVGAFGPGVEVGGGVRDRAAIEAYLELGASRVVLGTAALRDTKMVREAALAHPGRIVVAVDAKDGMVATDGWLEVSTTPALDLVRQLADVPLAAVLYTDISRDGTRVGPNVAATAKLARDGGVPVLASGGIATLDDLRELARCPGVAGAIVGRALYDGAFTLQEAVVAAGDESPR